MEKECFQVGDLVVNNKPEWGPGKIVMLDDQYAHVVWRDRTGKEAEVMHCSCLRKAKIQNDPALDYLPPLQERKGTLELPRVRIPIQESIRIFTKRFPGGFYDPAYLTDPSVGERQYKWDAHQYFVSNLGDGQFRRLLHDDPIMLIKRIEKCANINLLFSIERAAFHDALKDVEAAIPYLTRLAELLESSAISEQVFSPYAQAVRNLPAEIGKVASWPVATVIPFLAQPDRHMFLKPTVTRVAGETLGYYLHYSAEPNWLTYHSLLGMTREYMGKLAELKPRDFIDIQSFFWVVGNRLGPVG
jgi:hypothetical protein